jgi:hypothetical protein
VYNVIGNMLLCQLCLKGDLLFTVPSYPGGGGGGIIEKAKN